MPYVTEELWQRLHRPEAFNAVTVTDALPPSLCVAALPHDWKWDSLFDADAELAMSEAIQAVRTSRSLVKFVLDVLPDLKYVQVSCPFQVKVHVLL
jgi:valyl-tRNA synthetase